MCYRFNHKTGSTTDNHSYQPPRDTDQDSLYQKLAQDIYSSSPDRHTQTNFTSTLCYRHIHDIHDTDTTDHQRYTGNTSQQGSHQVCCSVEHTTQLLLGADGKVIIIRFFQLMFTTQNGRYLIYSLIGHIFCQSRSKNST